MGSLDAIPHIEGISLSDEGHFYDIENPPLPASGGESQAESNYTDGSGALFSMYLNRAEEEDKKAAERWKGDADGILVFVRLTRDLLLVVCRTH
ncbi:hypothetical protein BJV77DRAFT_1024490 [Russula vinacea]|nr:hypothetical protein BJV77DRAFT_1024490 [Russula vinacea]